MKVLSCPQNFARCSRAGNSEVNERMWPNFKHVWDFMAVLATYTHDDDPIKYEGGIVLITVLHYKSIGKKLSLKGK